MSPEILRFDSKTDLYSALIRRLESEVGAIQACSKNPVLALPTGNTMIPFYELASQNGEKLRVSAWKCFQLDEYHPLAHESESFGFRTYLREHFYSRVTHPPLLQESLSGFASDPKLECERYEKKIKQEGGIDLAILGIGVNGHIAFNEPGSPFDSRTRLVTLEQETLKSNFKESPPFSQAMTLGIGTLLEARKIWIVAASKAKANAVRNAIHQPADPSLPASALQLHSNVTWFLDSEAAGLL
jgi:glucosamine-6-phosphate deaminase